MEYIKQMQIVQTSHPVSRKDSKRICRGSKKKKGEILGGKMDIPRACKALGRGIVEQS